jgi:hypothetical protein
MPHREAETGWRAIVEDIDGEVAKSDHLGEAVDRSCDVIEAVAVAGAFGHVRLAKPGQIGRDDMEPVGELRNEIAEHMAGTWEAVQQQQRRRVLRPGLAKKDIEPVDIDLAVADLAHGDLSISNHLELRPEFRVRPAAIRR